MLVYGLAATGAAPHAPQLQAVLANALSGMEATGCPPRTLPVLMWSLVRLRRQPDTSWMRQVLVRSIEVRAQEAEGQGGAQGGTCVRG